MISVAQIICYLLHFPISKSHPLVSVISSRANSFVYLEVLIPLLKINKKQPDMTLLWKRRDIFNLSSYFEWSGDCQQACLIIWATRFYSLICSTPPCFFYPYEQTVPSKTRRVLSFQSDLPVLKIWDLIFFLLYFLCFCHIASLKCLPFFYFFFATAYICVYYLCWMNSWSRKPVKVKEFKN